jgi:hypothetical protein
VFVRGLGWTRAGILACAVDPALSPVHDDELEDRPTVCRTRRRDADMARHWPNSTIGRPCDPCLEFAAACHAGPLPLTIYKSHDDLASLARPSDHTHSTPSPGGCSGQRACTHAQLGVSETAHGPTLEYRQLLHGSSTHCHRSAALGLSSHSRTVAAGVRVQRLEQVVLDEGSPETVVIAVMELLNTARLTPLSAPVPHPQPSF